MDLVNETLAEGNDIETKDAELKEISTEIEQLNAQIEAIRETAQASIPGQELRLQEISGKIASWEKGLTEYDDSVVRQIVECIKVHHDGTLEVIFGGGITIIEQIPVSSKSNCGRKASQ